MHGLSIMQGLLDAIAEDASGRGFTAVEHVRITAGELSGVSPEELRFAFSLIIEGTMFEKASLEIGEIPGGREVTIDYYEGITPTPSARHPTQPSSRP